MLHKRRLSIRGQTKPTIIKPTRQPTEYTCQINPLVTNRWVGGIYGTDVAAVYNRLVFDRHVDWNIESRTFLHDTYWYMLWYPDMDIMFYETHKDGEHFLLEMSQDELHWFIGKYAEKPNDEA